MSEKNEILIVRELLDAGEEMVSGSHLAKRLGVSRVSIHGYMDKLRSQGYEFEAVRSKGYRLTQRPKELNQPLIQAQLTHAASQLRAIVLEEVDSTNSEAERRLANGEEAPFVVIARQQLNGRGRMGSSWHSPQNGNLYASFAFRPQVSPTRLALFTLWMGLNLCECINALYRVETGLKWPNDILLGDRKLAGILTEARMEADQVQNIVLGIGLNANSDGEDWPPELKKIATSLRQATGQELDLNRLVAAISGRAMIAYRQFLTDEHRALTRERWPRFDTLKGKTVQVLQGQNRIEGIAAGIDPAGSLIVERSDKTRYLARAGDVTLAKK